jgi:hypothetical protein
MTMMRLEEEMARLASLSPAQLRAEWRRVHRGQAVPAGLSSDLVARAIAWRLQEKVHGGMATARVRELERLAKQLDRTGELDLEREISLKPGTRLVRDWQGRTYRVLVVEDGYLFEERRYGSLTPIAKAITGAAWSGPRFFGLKRARKNAVGEAVHEQAA